MEKRTNVTEHDTRVFGSLLMSDRSFFGKEYKEERWGELWRRITCRLSLVTSCLKSNIFYSCSRAKRKQDISRETIPYRELFLRLPARMKKKATCALVTSLFSLRFFNADILPLS